MSEVDISREAVERQLSANIGTNGLAAKICRALLAEVERLRDRILEVSVNGYGWMALHDQLLGFIQKRPEFLKELLKDDPRGKFPSPRDVPDLVAERDQLRARIAELEADRRDAERYRWLRSESVSRRDEISPVLVTPWSFGENFPRQIDDAIDAAIAASKEGKT